MVRSPREAPDWLAMSSFSRASPGVMFSMAAASLAPFASPSAFDRFMSAIMSRSTAWMASSVPKPTFLTASTALLDASCVYAMRLREGRRSTFNVRGSSCRCGRRAPRPRGSIPSPNRGLS